MKMTFWGTRGSIPVSGPQFMRHGGATTCVELEAAGERVIVDCGTGLAELGKAKGGALDRARIYLTHMHWDHVQGFPFFAPLFNPGARFDLYAVPREGRSLRQVLDEQMSQPTFPVGLDIIPSTLNFRDMARQGVHCVGGLTVSWTEVWHPAGSSAYRFECGGASIVFTGDVEVRQGCADTLAAFAQGADVLIMDAQYLPEEYPSRVGFGHSTPLDAVEIARRAGVSRLILTHHDPTHDDLTLARKLQIARDAAGDALVVDNAYDRMELEVAPRPREGAPAPRLEAC